jgi:DNA-binding CsgD family transcriptional regulator
MQIPPAEVLVWAEYLEPAGFREGLGVALITSDRRHLGFLGFNMADRAPTPQGELELVELLAPTIARLVDPLASIGAAADMIGSTEAGVLVDRAGQVHSLPGLSSHPLLRTGGAVPAVAVDLLGTGGAHVSFLCLDCGAHAVRRYRRITAIRCQGLPPFDIRAAVLLGPPGPLYGLTRRELEILGLLIEGWPNQRIASYLTIASRTVAAHLEHILAKLDATSRTTAAVRAFRQGLYLPQALTNRQQRPAGPTPDHVDVDVLASRP